MTEKQNTTPSSAERRAQERLVQSAVYSVLNEKIASGFGDKTLVQVTKHTCLPQDIAKVICAILDRGRTEPGGP